MCTAQSRFAIRRDGFRKRLLKYTRKALRCLPQMDHPRILDIGCGTGFPTLELARLTDGEITGMDNNGELLNILDKKIKKAGLSNRVKTVNCSIEAMEFPPESFDLIWAEGSIFVLGFQKSLQSWKYFLKPGGFLVMHDQKDDIEEKLKLASSEGYLPVNYFELNQRVWWNGYFAPLEKLINKTQETAGKDAKQDADLLEAQKDLAVFRKNPVANQSVFYILQRNE